VKAHNPLLVSSPKDLPGKQNAKAKPDQKPRLYLPKISPYYHYFIGKLAILMIQGLSHITLTISELDRSLQFYQQLGLKEEVRWDQGAYLSAPQLWLCLHLGQPKPSQDYSHIAFSIDPQQIPILQQQFESEQWQQNQSEGESVYLLDPDGHKLELHCGNLASRLKSLKSPPYAGLKWPQP